MVTRARRGPAATARVHLRPPVAGDARRFIDAVNASRRLHGRWVQAPATPAAFRTYVARSAGARHGDQHAGFLAIRIADGALIGVVNISEIVRGAFRSAYLGYYGFLPHAGRGYMTEALSLALDQAFGTLALHRIEANVQPANARSIALLERSGFTREGYSRRYMKLGGRWRDHVRYAMLAEDWKALRRKPLRSDDAAMPSDPDRP